MSNPRLFTSPSQKQQQQWNDFYRDVRSHKDQVALVKEKPKPAYETLDPIAQKRVDAYLEAAGLERDGVATPGLR